MNDERKKKGNEDLEFFLAGTPSADGDLAHLSEGAGNEMSFGIINFKIKDDK